MPMPWTYRHASREFRALLDDVKDRSGLDSDNQAYTCLEGTLHAFRRRLTVAEALAFADRLPSIPRAIFVAQWTPAEVPVPFGSRAEMTREVQELRQHHNLAPDNSIEAVAYALRRRIHPRDWEAAMAALPADATTFWEVPGVDPADLRPTII